MIKKVGRLVNIKNIKTSIKPRVLLKYKEEYNDLRCLLYLHSYGHVVIYLLNIN